MLCAPLLVRTSFPNLARANDFNRHLVTAISSRTVETEYVDGCFWSFIVEKGEMLLVLNSNTHMLKMRPLRFGSSRIAFLSFPSWCLDGLPVTYLGGTANEFNVSERRHRRNTGGLRTDIIQVVSPDGCHDYCNWF
jgi:hypothetical protein